MDFHGSVADNTDAYTPVPASVIDNVICRDMRRQPRTDMPTTPFLVQLDNQECIVAELALRDCIAYYSQVAANNADLAPRLTACVRQFESLLNKLQTTRAGNNHSDTKQVA